MAVDISLHGQIFIFWKYNLKEFRCEQDSNLRGNIPMDFKSIALTTRPSQLI